MAQRLRGRFGYPQEEPFAVTWHPERILDPFHWKKPQNVFVCSMGDLFHPRVPIEWLRPVFRVMLQAPQHSFQVLTKRPGRMAWWAKMMPSVMGAAWPDNVWAGTSVENEKYLPRLDVLARVPAKVRFVSLEPLLGPVDLRPWLGRDWRCVNCQTWNHTKDGAITLAKAICECGVGQGTWAVDRPLSWVIVGGESGPGARPMEEEWVRSICVDVGVAFFYKQAIIDGEKIATPTLDGRSWVEVPDAIQRP